MRGVGWAICYQDPHTGKLSNHWVTLHEMTHAAGLEEHSNDGIFMTLPNIDNNGNATICWSSPNSNATAHPKGTPVTLPTGIGGTANANTTVIWSEGGYAYTLPVGSGVLNMTSMQLSEQFYLKPRRVNQINRCSTGTCTSVCP